MNEDPRNVGPVCQKCIEERKAKTQELLRPLYRGQEARRLIGKTVKLCFTDGSVNEHMWVRTNSIEFSPTDPPLLIGILDNDPMFVNLDLKCGDTIYFTMDEIEEISEEQEV